MIWLKLLIGALTVALSVAIGYVLAGKYRERSKFYAQMYAFNERYLSELAFSRKPLADLIAQGEYTGDFAKLLEGARKGGDEPKLSYLQKEEREDAAEYVFMLGRGDSNSQTGFFDAQKHILEQKKQTAEREAKARTALYLKLGLLAGLALVILIV